MAVPEPAAGPPLSALRPGAPPGTVVLVLGTPVRPADVPGICAHARALLEDADVDRLVCDVGAVVDADVDTVDVLARLHLTARRLAVEIPLRNASPGLRALLDLVGLSDVLATGGGLRLGRQAEQREQRGGVEERVDPADPAV